MIDRLRSILGGRWPTLVCAVGIFVLAVTVRLPVCYESFWVDELHTAWTIWGDFDQVYPRASVGNQTPLYFYLMWFWKAVVGESEAALRLSSVLAVSGAAALLVCGIRQTSKNLFAGVLAGLILALDINSLFFGTEFRPYAFVVLFATVTTWAAVCLVSEQTKISRANLRLVFTIAAGLAALMHPTSIVSIGVLLLVTMVIVVAQGRATFQFQVSDFVSLIVVCAVAFALLNSSLSDSWENRERWSAFGSVSTWTELWIKWPWIFIAIIPALVSGISVFLGKRSEALPALLPLIAGVIATTLFFLASYYQWVPLWHRRYFIAALPMMAWSAGACSMLAPAVESRFRSAVNFTAVALIAVGICWQQGTLSFWAKGQYLNQLRFEDWRGAVDWVSKNRGERDFVFINAGLIEAQILTQSHSELRPVQYEYFLLPAKGPYFIQDAKNGADPWDRSFRMMLHATQLPLHDLRDMREQSEPGDTPQTVWLIMRANRQRVDQFCANRWMAQFAAPELKRFGNELWLVKFSGPNTPQLKEIADLRTERLKELAKRYQKQLQNKAGTKGDILNSPEK